MNQQNAEDTQCSTKWTVYMSTICVTVTCFWPLTIDSCSTLDAEWEDQQWQLLTWHKHKKSLPASGFTSCIWHPLKICSSVSLAWPRPQVPTHLTGFTFWWHYRFSFIIFLGLMKVQKYKTSTAQKFIIKRVWPCLQFEVSCQQFNRCSSRTGVWSMWKMPFGLQGIFCCNIVCGLCNHHIYLKVEYET